MAKNTKTYLIVGIVVIVAILVFGNQMGLYSTIGLGDYEVARSCDIASANYLEGADASGQCYIYTSNNVDRIAFVESMTETSNECSVSPACPDGANYHCSIDSCTSCWEKIFTCDVAYKNGQTVKVCKYDSDCPSMNCVNAICQDGLPSQCTDVGETRCSSATKYQTCLSNGQWSGLLNCPQTTTCYTGKCMTQQQIDDTNQDDTGGDDTPTGGIDSTTLLYIGGGIVAVLLVMSLMRGK